MLHFLKLLFSQVEAACDETRLLAIANQKLAAIVIGEIEPLSSCKSTKIIQGLDLREIKLIVIASRIRFGMIFIADIQL